MVGAAVTFVVGVFVPPSSVATRPVRGGSVHPAISVAVPPPLIVVAAPLFPLSVPLPTAAVPIAYVATVPSPVVSAAAVSTPL